MFDNWFKRYHLETKLRSLFLCLYTATVTLTSDNEIKYNRGCVHPIGYYPTKFFFISNTNVS